MDPHPLSIAILDGTALAPASAFPAILKGQYGRQNLAIFLLMRPGIAHKVDAGLTKMVEFDEFDLPYRDPRELNDRRMIKAIVLTQTKGIHRCLIMSS